jgi:hypothetical protein
MSSGTWIKRVGVCALVVAGVAAVWAVSTTSAAEKAPKGKGKTKATATADAKATDTADAKATGTADAAATPTTSASTISMPAGYTGKPYPGATNEIPGIIQAESYDVAPDNKADVTWHYGSGGKKNDCRTTGDSIGLAKFGGGHVNTKGDAEKQDQIYLGWTQSGEWMKYTVHVKEAGTYKIGGKFASGGKESKISIKFSPDDVTRPLAIPTTAGFQPSVEVYHVWLTSENLAEVTLPAGDTVMTVTLDKADGLNVDFISFTKK